MDRYSENQYDDLTLGGDYDDSYFSDSDDLFDLNPAEDSPISRLKSLVLSIDWEITDEVLLMFNEELLSLRDVWAGEKINLVYVQALEKISKYIYARKANAHPSAIKLLLTLYHSLEKVITSEDMTEEQKVAMVREDVKAFERLKVHIKRDMAAIQPVSVLAEEEVASSSVETEEQAAKETFVPPVKAETVSPVSESLVLDEEEKGVPAALNVSNIEHGTVSTLLRLKAIILGLDWEITDEYLTNLKLEVADLQEHFSGNESCLDLLGGIGEVGEYIKEKKAEAHSEAFKVLHLLFEGLEHLLSVSVSPAEERSSVFPLLEKLQAFRMIREDEKTQVSDALPAGGPVASLSGGEEVAPAFSSLDEKEVHGFWAEEEEGASALMDDADVGDVVDSFFGENETVGFEPAALAEEIEKIPGLDVEEDDAAEPVAALSSQGDEPAPALSFEEEESELSETSSFAGDTEMEVAAALGLDNGEEERPDFSVTSENQVAAALEGVNVEEGDDDDDDLVIPDVVEPIAFASDISEIPEEDETPLQADSPAGDGGMEPDQVSEDVEAAEREVAAALGLDDGEEERPDFSVTSGNQAAAALEGVNVEEDDDDDDDLMMPGVAESIAFASDISEAPEEDEALLQADSPAGDGGIESDQVSEVAEGDVEAAEREVAAALGLDDGEEERPDFSVTSENQAAAALEGVNVEEDDDDDDDFVVPDSAESIAFASDISETPEEEEAVPLKSLSPSDAASATAGTVESIAAAGGLAGSAVMSDFAAGGEDVDEIKESLDGFFGRDEEILSVPVEADSASDAPVVFLLAENDEEQDSVQNLRMYSEEFVQGGAGASIEEVLSERDRLQGLMQGRPIELNLLQLFSTVANSLSKDDEPTDAESIALLRSTSQALAEVLADADIVRDLEVLRVETGKVLEWLSSRRV